MRILATIEIEDLETLYELTYKYGWFEVFEREYGGWLPDQAYLQKAKIEHRLKDVTTNALDEMADTYAEWLDFHIEDGWIDAMEEHYIEHGIQSMFEQFDFWGILFAAEQLLYKAVAEAPGVEQGISELGEADNILEAYDFDLVEYLRDNFTPQDLLETYSNVLDFRGYLRGVYQVYLDRFPGLEKEIFNIAKTYEDVRNAYDSDDIGEQILAFQLGLTTAHHHGVMADHLLELPTGEGQKVLDKLSSGPNVKKWDRDIERALGQRLQYKSE